MNTNLNSSNRLIPSGQDMYVEKMNNKFIIADLRKNFGSEKSGLIVKMEITKFNGKPREVFLPKTLTKNTEETFQKMSEIK